MGVAVSALIGGTSEFVSPGVSSGTWCPHSSLAAGSITTSVSVGARAAALLAAASAGGAGPAAAGTAGQGSVGTGTADLLAATVSLAKTWGMVLGSSTK